MCIFEGIWKKKTPKVWFLVSLTACLPEFSWDKWMIPLELSSFLASDATAYHAGIKQEMYWWVLWGKMETFFLISTPHLGRIQLVHLFPNHYIISSEKKLHLFNFCVTSSCESHSGSCQKKGWYPQTSRPVMTVVLFISPALMFWNCSLTQNNLAQWFPHVLSPGPSF